MDKSSYSFCTYINSDISKVSNFIDTINIGSDEWLVVYKAYNQPYIYPKIRIAYL